MTRSVLSIFDDIRALKAPTKRTPTNVGAQIDALLDELSDALDEYEDNEAGFRCERCGRWHDRASRPCVA